MSTLSFALAAVSGKLAVVTLAAACAPGNPKPVVADAKPVVRGQASYRERIALLPGAVFEATLEDVSRPGAKAEVLGTFRKEDPGQVPIRFEIPYDPAKIDGRHTYAVRARILKGNTLGFTTDTVYPVLTQGNGSEVDLLLVRVRSAGGRPTPK